VRGDDGSGIAAADARVTGENTDARAARAADAGAAYTADGATAIVDGYYGGDRGE